MCARENFLERSNSVLQGNKFTLITGENLCDLERLRHETLDLTRTLDLQSSQFTHHISKQENYSP